jgi:AcrR family transcriptional regulator
MPRPNPSRRDHLADTAIGLLAEAGARGLTHRAVDAAADVPPGTTSRYFRTREALLRGVVDRSLESLSATLRGLGEVAVPRGVDALVDALARVVRDAVTVEWARTAAMGELFMESRRRPDLDERLRAARRVLLERFSALAKAAGFELSEADAVVLLTVVTGIAFSSVTSPSDSPGQVLGVDVETLVRRAVTGVLKD